MAKVILNKEDHFSTKYLIQIIEINDLPCDLLSELFEFLSNKETFQIECVCKNCKMRL